jgi:hypothetical protein
MPYHVQCPGCLTSAYLDCACPDGHDAMAAGHHESCRMGDIDAQVACPPGSSCCQEDHHHGDAANAGTVCRPLIITAMPGSATMFPVGG